MSDQNQDKGKGKAIAESEEQQSSLLLNLPAELRGMIFEYALLADGGHFIFKRGGSATPTLKLSNPNPTLVSLLLVSKLTCKETAALPFKLKRIIIERETTPETLLRELHAFLPEDFQRAAVRHVVLDVSITAVMSLGGVLNTAKYLFPGIQKLDFYHDVKDNSIIPQQDGIKYAMGKWKKWLAGMSSVQEKPAVAFYVRLDDGRILPYSDPDAPASSAAAS